MVGAVCPGRVAPLVALFGDAGGDVSACLAGVCRCMPDARPPPKRLASASVGATATAAQATASMKVISLDASRWRVEIRCMFKARKHG